MLPQDQPSEKNEVILSNLMDEIISFSSYRRAEAIKQLGQLDIPISELPLKIHSNLEKSLNDPETEVRRETVMTLAFLEGEIAIPLIEPLIYDSNQSVRSSVIAALGFIGSTPSEKTINTMIKYLDDPDPEIRDRCARALGRMNSLMAIAKLLELAEFDNSPIVRAGAIVGIGMMKEKNSSILSRIQKFLHQETSQLVRNTIKETFLL